jgi:cytidylate kinase
VKGLNFRLVSDMAKLIITIDGPAASGKSTVARLVAQRLGASFLDTGAMYRAVTLAAMQAAADMSDQHRLLEVLNDREFQFAIKQDEMKVSIDGVDVTGRLREPQITANARHVASAPRLRKKLVQMQRQIAAQAGTIVTEGRDQGTVAFADANIKFYLTADPAERAKRRQAELQEKGSHESLEKIQRAIEERDRSDQNRAVGPLTPASNAIVVDTTDLTVEQVVEKLLSCVEENA